MKQAVVKSVKAGNPFDGPNGMLYGWWVTMDNGDNISVNTQKQDTPPWREGEMAFYEIKKTHQGKKGPWHTAKKIKNPAFGEGGVSGSSTSTGHAGHWTPEKEKSIMVQAFIKSIIESGAAQTNWEPLLGSAIALHDKYAGKPAAAPAPAPTTAAPAPVQKSIVDPPDEDDLPF